MPSGKRELHFLFNGSVTSTPPGWTVKQSAIKYFETQTRYARMQLIPRPSYCDRGKWEWHIESTNYAAFTIDGADMFPRLYFKLANALDEIAAWCRERKQLYMLGPDFIRCLLCDNTSHNPVDVVQRYCGHCHRSLDDPPANPG